jgi:cold shock CspA family protein
MADSYQKKEREKKRRKRKQDKLDKREEKKGSESKTETFMYIDEFGQLSPTPPDLTVKRTEIKLEEIRISTPKKSDDDVVDFVKRGVVKFFNQEKRFGFITETMTNIDYFFHEENTIDAVTEKDNVEFELTDGPKGLVAKDVKLAKIEKEPAAKKEDVTEKKDVDGETDDKTEEA